MDKGIDYSESTVLSMIKREYDYDCDMNHSKLTYIDQGNSKFVNPKDGKILSTLGIATCLGLMAFSKEFSYLAHIDMGKETGFNFDNNGRCIRIQELLEKIKQTPNLERVWIGTISSEQYRYEKKWWDATSVEVDQEIENFISYCRDTLHIKVERIPHIPSSFITLDSQTGECYFDSWECLTQSNIMHMDKTSYLASKGSKRNKFSIGDIKERVGCVESSDTFSIDGVFKGMNQCRRGRFGNDR